jgi:hypothetical protein
MRYAYPLVSWSTPRGQTGWWWGGLNQQGVVPVGTSLRQEGAEALADGDRADKARSLTRRMRGGSGWLYSTEHRRRESCRGEKSRFTGYRILYRFFLQISERSYWVRIRMNNNSVRLCNSLITAV